MTDSSLTNLTLPMDAIRAFCQKWGIREFALFGSVLRADFDDASDVDVLVAFGEDVRRTLFDLVTMTDELEALFGRKVDVVTRRSVEDSPNYIRRREIVGSAQVVCAANSMLHEQIVRQQK